MSMLYCRFGKVLWGCFPEGFYSQTFDIEQLADLLFSKDGNRPVYSTQSRLQYMYMYRYIVVHVNYLYNVPLFSSVYSTQSRLQYSYMHVYIGIYIYRCKVM